MKLKKKLHVLLIYFGLFGSFYAQGQDDTSSTPEKKEKKVTFIPLPIVAANPTTGFVFGVAPGVTWVNGDPATTSLTSFLGNILYTANQQLLLGIRGNTFLSEDRWALTTDIRFLLNSQPTYGLSTNPNNFNNTVVGGGEEVSDDIVNGPDRSEMIGFDYFRLHQIVMRRHGDTRFFYGLGYHLDLMYNIDDRQLDLAAVPPRITHHYQYQTVKGLPLDQYSLSGVSLNGAYDSRDNVANPYHGRLISTSFRINPDFLGSTASSSLLWVEYRDYFNVSKSRPRNLIAVWAFGWFVTSGKVPYMYLPATGWDLYARSGRPYTQGRFRGEDLVYTEAEWRFPLQKNKNKLGGVIFVNMTTASSRTDNVNLFSYAQPGIGTGLRYTLSEKNRVNIALDYGWGVHQASALFLSLNESF